MNCAQISSLGPPTSAGFPSNRSGYNLHLNWCVESSRKLAAGLKSSPCWVGSNPELGAVQKVVICSAISSNNLETTKKMWVGGFLVEINININFILFFWRGKKIGRFWRRDFYFLLDRKYVLISSVLALWMSFSSILAPQLPTRCWTIARWPFWEAKYNGVFPHLFFTSTSAPLWMRNWVTWSWPSSEEQCNSVLCHLSFAFMFAPLSTRNSAMGRCPFSAARWGECF